MSFYLSLKALGALPLPPPDMCGDLDFSDGGLLPQRLTAISSTHPYCTKECAHRGVVISTYVPNSQGGSKPKPPKKK